MSLQLQKVAAGWCRRHRHLPVRVQHAALSRRIQGHFNYFGVSGNYRNLVPLVEATKRNWLKWLRRRSNRSRLTWERYAALLERFPLPTPRIGFACGSGVRSHEPHQRRSRMVEISKSGSGEGPGGAIPRGDSTAASERELELGRHSSGLNRWRIGLEAEAREDAEDDGALWRGGSWFKSSVAHQRACRAVDSRPGHTPRRTIPDPHCSVVSCAQQVPAVRAEGDRADHVGLVV